MNKTTIKVPAGIRYIGTWQDFHLSNFPAKCIINKVLPGCGFTRYCIESKFENVILCSPRKMLLQNKYEQHKFQAYLVRNDYDKDPGVDRDLEKDVSRLAASSSNSIYLETQKILDEYEDPMKNKMTGIKARLHTELREYMNGHMQGWKILVTYDSFRVVKEVLTEMGVFQDFFVVIDEMQAIMSDARFKSSTEINFLYHLGQSHSALFVSATPMLEEYLDELAEFKDLPYYELDWKSEDLSRISRPDLDVRRMDATPRTLIKRIIDDYRTRGFADSVMTIENGSPVVKQATELVFYLNSVNGIIAAIKACKLTDSEVNILCSNTPDNQKRIWDKLGKKSGFQIGRVPLEGEPRKPFTFCTRTVYLGADFYSDRAKSYIFSDANSKYLSVDISQDLPQILGRQRCDSNPWKNSAVFYYKLTDIMNGDFDYQGMIDSKRKDTSNLIDGWYTLGGEKEQQSAFSNSILLNINAYHYENNYVSINKEEIIDSATGKKEYVMMPVENHLVRVAEKRAFEIQQIDYADRFSVFTALSNELGPYQRDSSEENPIEFQVEKFFEQYDEAKYIPDRLKLLCEVSMSPEALNVILAQIPDTDKAKPLFLSAGPEICRANSYAPSRIEKVLGVKFYSKKTLRDEIYSFFKEGDRVSLKNIKSELSDIYQRLSYDKTPKAKDIEEFFEVKRCTITDPETNKRLESYELIRKLQ